MNKPIYFPGLNALRAISALAVVISHVTLGLGFFGLDPYIFGAIKDGSPAGLSLAGYGVSIFFALSGFLITYLLEEEKETSKIDIKKFYLRRILRIWPLYYLYLVIAIIAISLFGVRFKSTTLLCYILFAANIPFIRNVPILLIAHYWSIGVEEQFYLFWPWVVKKASRNIVPILVVATIILISIKVIFHFLYPASIVVTCLEVNRFHCMLMGAIGAILYRRKNKLFLAITDNKISQLVGFIVIFLAAINKFHVASIVDNELVSMIAVVLIIGQINIKNRLINLDTEFFDYLGKMSYGIYIIHPLIIFLFYKFISVGSPVWYKYVLIYLGVIAATLLVAHLSYKYYETYFLKLKRKVSVVVSSGTKHIEE